MIQYRERKNVWQKKQKKKKKKRDIKKGRSSSNNSMCTSCVSVSTPLSLFMLVASRDTKCTYVYAFAYSTFFLSVRSVAIFHISYTVYTHWLYDWDGSYAFEYRRPSCVSNISILKRYVCSHTTTTITTTVAIQKRWNVFENKLQTTKSEKWRKNEAKSYNIYGMNSMCVHSIIYIFSLSIAFYVHFFTQIYTYVQTLYEQIS